MTYLQFIQWPAALSLAIVLPLLTAWLVRRGLRAREQRLARLGTPSMVARLAPSLMSHRIWTRVLRASIAALLLGVAFAGPRWGVEQTIVKQEGVDVVLALDASNSMLAADERPSRLAAMKQEINRLRDLSPGDRFALLAFAGRSYILTPLTIDNSALDLFLTNFDPTIVAQGGSSLGSALRQSTNLLSLGKGEADRAIVLMSDGEGFENADEVLAEARRARESGLTVITVGFGTTRGSTIPVVQNRVVTRKLDEAGAVVITRYQPGLLREIAEEARGTFIDAGVPDRAGKVRVALNALRANPRSLVSGENLAARFQWFVLPALVLLALDAYSQTRRRRRRAVAAAATTAAMLLVMAGCNPKRDKAAIALYNAGTSMLLRDSLPEAIAPLTTASDSRDPEVRHHARFNLGLDYLKQGLKPSDSAGAQLDTALYRYKQILEIAVADSDARWNYELALRKKQSGGGGGGGGGGGDTGGRGADPAPTPARNPNQAPAPRPVPGMTPRQAEAILNAAEDRETDVQGNRQKKNVPAPPRGKDW